MQSSADLHRSPSKLNISDGDGWVVARNARKEEIKCLGNMMINGGLHLEKW
jgi:hypothetical protein